MEIFVFLSPQIKFAYSYRWLWMFRFTAQFLLFCFLLVQL
jgi:hypothetical protein